MNWATLFLIFLIALFVFFFLGQKVAFSLALASLIGFYLIGDTAGLQMVGRAVWKSAVSFELTAVPLFMFMLGHYDAGFTLRTYTHATRQKQDEAAQTMGSFMAQVM